MSANENTNLHAVYNYVTGRWKKKKQTKTNKKINATKPKLRKIATI